MEMWDQAFKIKEKSGGKPCGFLSDNFEDFHIFNRLEEKEKIKKGYSLYFPNKSTINCG